MFVTLLRFWQNTKASTPAEPPGAQALILEALFRRDAEPTPPCFRFAPQVRAARRHRLIMRGRERASFIPSYRQDRLRPPLLVRASSTAASHAPRSPRAHPCEDGGIPPNFTPAAHARHLPKPIYSRIATSERATNYGIARHSSRAAQVVGMKNDLPRGGAGPRWRAHLPRRSGRVT